MAEEIKQAKEAVVEFMTQMHTYPDFKLVCAIFTRVYNVLDRSDIELIIPTIGDYLNITSTFDKCAAIIAMTHPHSHHIHEVTFTEAEVRILREIAAL